MQNYWENLTLGKNIREKVYNISEIAECRKVPYLVSTVLTHFCQMYIFYEHVRAPVDLRPGAEDGPLVVRAHGCARRNVQAVAACLLAVEFERRIRFVEMVVRPNLNRTVTGVGDRQGHGLGVCIQFDFGIGRDDFTGDHCVCPRR